MHALKYVSSVIFIPLTFASILWGGWWSFGVPLVAFGLIPLAELWLGPDAENLTAEQEQAALSSRFYDGLLYSLVPLHVLQVVVYLVVVSQGQMAWWHWLGATWSVGIACGAFGINVGHELGHRKKWYEQTMAKILLWTSLYMHFFIEHNRGHHKKVATEEDPASARYGETVYAFWLRSTIGGYLSAWEIESERLKKKGMGWFHWQNEMLRFQVIQAATVFAVYWFLGVAAMASFLAVATLGFLLLETINYLEHYGLTRKRKENGRYESVLPIHSWNSDHTIGRVILFELTRHSDHHAHANRHYQVLRHFDESPQLPTGYPGMMILALCPPLWFRVMHRQIEHYKAQLEAC